MSICGGCRNGGFENDTLMNESFFGNKTCYTNENILQDQNVAVVLMPVSVFLVT